MTKVLGFCGKGGAGKTTIATLAIKTLLQERKASSVLAVDGDPNECLPSTLGIAKYSRLSDLLGKAEGKTVNPIQFADDIKMLILNNEQDGYDLFVMGRGEGEGCYCMVNNLLRKVVEEEIIGGPYAYKYVVMDMEAGLEHISRKTSAPIDDLFIVTDPSQMGLKTIERVLKVSAEVESDVKNVYILSNRVRDERMVGVVEGEAKRLGVTFLGNIPHDPVVEEFNMTGRPLLQLPENSPAYLRVRELLSPII